VSALRELGRSAMKSLAEALEGGRLTVPFSSNQLRKHIPNELVDSVQSELTELGAGDMTAAQFARVLRLLAEERAAAHAVADRVSLVWSGTDPGKKSRDTAIVVQELFRRAKRTVLIASYALDAGPKAKAIFGTLVDRLDAEPEFKVRLYVNVRRKYKATTAEAILLREFADRFRKEVWPGKRLPEVFYDPRSLASDGWTRACLHAKCIVIDEDRALITSANFTEAAHERNLEAGAVITDTIFARRLKAQFGALVNQGALKRVPGL
jgi:phosphatidylserine/phosphatidylglycerophosphate/cardiolipin synthase-like enzyme